MNTIRYMQGSETRLTCIHALVYLENWCGSQMHVNPWPLETVSSNLCYITSQDNRDLRPVPGVSEALQHK